VSDTLPPITYALNRRAYEVAKAKAGIRSDAEVARRTGLHKVTVARVLSGEYPLTERVRQQLLNVFPDDYDTIVQASDG
jgi:lambda repressor-like predicted transcriptional regulator